MTAAGKFTAEGTVTRDQPGRLFDVTLDNGHKLLAYLCGRMMKKYIRVLPNDRVVVELDSYDLSRGRIVYRFRD